MNQGLLKINWNFTMLLKEMSDKDDYMSHIILLQDLINEYEMKLRL